MLKHVRETGNDFISLALSRRWTAAFHYPIPRVTNCGKKQHSIGCLVECDKILTLSPELLKATQEFSKEMEESIKRDLRHYEIKRQISEMLSNQEVDWSEISRFERLVAEYRNLTPSYYTR